MHATVQDRFRALLLYTHGNPTSWVGKVRPEEATRCARSATRGLRPLGCRSEPHPPCPAVQSSTLGQGLLGTQLGRPTRHSWREGPGQSLPEKLSVTWRGWKLPALSTEQRWPSRVPRAPVPLMRVAKHRTPVSIDLLHRFAKIKTKETRD